MDLVASEPGHLEPASLGILLTAASGTLPTPSPSPAPTSVGNYQLDPFCCHSGLGVSVVYNNNGLCEGQVTLHLDAPSVTFRIGVAGGKLTAALELHGATGIRVAFEAGSTADSRATCPINACDPRRVQLPCPGGTTTLDDRLRPGVRHGYGVHREGLLFSAIGDYSFGGTLGFGFVNGIPTVYTPHTLTPTTTMTKTMVSGRSVPLGGHRHAAKLSVGIGLGVFQVAPWYGLTFAVGVYGSGISSEFQCKQVSLDLSSSTVFGYRMPKPGGNGDQRLPFSLGTLAHASGRPRSVPPSRLSRTQAPSPPLVACV